MRLKFALLIMSLPDCQISRLPDRQIRSPKLNSFTFGVASGTVMQKAHVCQGFPGSSAFNDCGTVLCRDRQQRTFKRHMSSGEDMLRAGISQLQNGELAAHSPSSPTATIDYHSWRLTDSIGEHSAAPHFCCAASLCQSHPHPPTQ